MDDQEAETFANRDEPIPVLRIPFPDDEAADSDNEDTNNSAREAVKSQVDKLKDKMGNVKEELRSGGIQERLFNSVMAQIIPTEDSEQDSNAVKDRRSHTYVDRPSFSLPLMSTNFRRFNSRIGIVFVFQNQLIRLFSWRTPTHTLSFLAAYTLVCLQPALIPAVPLALIFFYIMIPSFLTRHPPPPYPSENTLQHSADPDTAAEMETAWTSYAYTIHATAPPKRVRPAPEMSKDFFRNMRDLQNCMEDFSRVHDAAIANIAPYTDFSDEKLSSTVFLSIFTLLSVATVTAHLVPWRLLSVLAGWAATVSGHPTAQDLLADLQSSKTVRQAHARSQSWIQSWIDTDILLDEPPEVREVEVFELQRRQNQNIIFPPGSPSVGPSRSRRTSENAPSFTTLKSFASSSLDTGSVEFFDGDDDEAWEAWLFTPSPHDPLSPSRLSGAWPAGTQFFEDVQPPPGWLWRDKKWTLDLLSEAWVEERCVTGVEVEREGGRWVYDIAYPEGEGKTPKKKKEKAQVGGGVKSWEEGTGKGKKGDWRRRRWVRLVERRAQHVHEDE